MVRRLSILVVLLGLLAACGAPAAESPTTAPAAPTAAPAAEQPTAAPAAFPVTIAHKFGETTIPTAPQRVVTVGLVEQDALLALGITPVGTTQWFGENPGAIWPWATAKLTGPLPELVGDASGPNFERIAALQPDLILALYSGVTEEQYGLLSQIAPTVAQPAAYVDYGVPWQELTRTVGQAVGKAAEADAVVRGVEEQFATVREQHPEFVSATAVVATPYQGIWVYGSQDARGRLLTDLGFTLPAEIDTITGAGFGGNLSMERADLLDVDVIIWLDPESAEGPLGGPLYETFAVHTEGREVFLKSTDDPLGAATSIVTPLSIPFLLERLVPQLAAAVDGDPATTTGDAGPASTTSDATVATLACEPGFRPFAHSAGETCVPEQPRRIVTTQDQNALLPLLELGVRPVGSAGQPLESGGFRFRRVADFETSGIAFVGNYWGEANAESITRLNPDLIIGDAFGADYYDLHSQIAPTVLIDVHGRPLDEALLDFAALVGRGAQAAELRAAYQQRVAALLDALGERKDTLSVSVITSGDPGQFYRADTGQAIGTVMDALNLPRPTPQRGEGSFDAFSIEALPDHDADVVLVINFAGDGQDPGFDALVTSPLFTTLAAARAGQTYVIDGTLTVGAGWSKMDAFLAELERILLAPELKVDVIREAN